MEGHQNPHVSSLRKVSQFSILVPQMHAYREADHNTHVMNYNIPLALLT